MWVLWEVRVYVESRILVFGLLLGEGSKITELGAITRLSSLLPEGLEVIGESE